MESQEESSTSQLVGKQGIQTQEDIQRVTLAQKKKKKTKWIIIGIVLGIIVILAIVLPIVLIKKDNPNIYQGYNPYAADQSDVVDDQASFSGKIKLKNQMTQQQSLMQRVYGGLSNYGVDTQNIKQGINNEMATEIKFRFEMINQRHSRLSIGQDNAFSIPSNILNNPGSDSNQRLEMLGFTYSLSPFSFQYADNRDLSKIFLTTKNQALVFMDKYIQMDFVLPSQRMFGLGQRVREFQLGEGTWTMWAQGNKSEYDDGSGRKGNAGVHPFILVQGYSKDDFIGLYFRNSNFQSPVIRYNTDGTSILSYITTGGQIELYMFIHGSVSQILSTYHQVIGTPTLPPFWALGFQQSSQKYNSQIGLQAVIDGYSVGNINLETIYLDAPYLSADFKVDTIAYPDLPGFSDTLHRVNQKIVTVMEGHLSAEDTTSTYYQMADQTSTLIKSGAFESATYNNNLVAIVNALKVVFLDWLNDSSLYVISSGLNALYSQVAFDGIWIDMNEPTIADNGEFQPPDALTKQPEEIHFLKRILLAAFNSGWYTSIGDQSVKSTYSLPFVPQYAQYGSFDQNTISLNATHSKSGQIEYNMHSLYGHMMAWRTQQFLTKDTTYKNTDNRPFVLTKSTFAGSGQFGSHSISQNYATWEDMRRSISGIMNMNMFGIPHSGVDICGFYSKDVRDDEMCAYWIQLSAFYPLARMNQNLTAEGETPDIADNYRHEPYYLSQPYQDIASNSILERYKYIRHIYTCLFQVSQGGGSCFSPLFYQYPHDDNVYNDYEQAFIVGGSLIIAPVLESLVKSGSQKYSVYLPKGVYVNLANYGLVDNSAGGKNVTLTASQIPNVFLIDGRAIPFQELNDAIRTTTAVQTIPIAILANLDENGNAYGRLFLDTGISRKEIQTNQYEHYDFSFQSNSIIKHLIGGTQGSQSQHLSKIQLVNVPELSETNFACMFDTSLQMRRMTVTYDDGSKSLTIRPDQPSPLLFSEFTSIYYGNSEVDLNLCNPNSYAYKIVGQFPDLKVNSTSIVLQNVGGVLPNVEVLIRLFDYNIINIKWSWQRLENGSLPYGIREPFEIPQYLVNTTMTQDNLGGLTLDKFITITSAPFTISLLDRDPASPDNLFTMKGFLFDQFLNSVNVTLKAASGDQFQGIFGLGERNQDSLFYPDGVYSMFARDGNMGSMENGKAPGNNQYSVHPYFMYKHKPNQWVGVYYNNPTAQDWWIKNTPATGQIDITAIATGGISDFYIITAINPDAVLKGYYTIVGKPVLIPNWALGWHQCKWGYKNLAALEAVQKGYADNKIPLDVQWSDIDYLRLYQDFEYDTTKYAGLPQFIQTLHKNNKKWVPIIDAGIALRPNQNYTAYDTGLKKDIFIKIKEEVMIGQVWPSDAVFPDFLHPEAGAWWRSNFDRMQQNLNFDGIWLDMNENADFCFGVCYDSQSVQNSIQTNLKYVPTSRNLEWQYSMPMDSYRHGGIMELDAHSLAGMLEVEATHQYFVEKKQRTFIIARSSFAGQGKYGSKWLGDNEHTNQRLSQSVLGTMMFNIFGIPLVGADICGFSDVASGLNNELCARWHVVGALQPFSRNHHVGNDIEPFRFKGILYEPGVDYMTIMTNAIYNKYALNKYYYTQITMMSLDGEGTFYKPLFFSYPEDINAYQNPSMNIMIGDYLKLSVNSMQTNVNTTSFYFPAGLWCNIMDPINDPCFTSTGQSIEKRSKAYDFYLHLVQGSIVPMQDAKTLGVQNTVDLQQYPIDLHILGNQVSPTRFVAEGYFINDDGLTLDLLGNQNVYYLQASAQITVDPTPITIDVYQQNIAFNYISKTDASCSAVNQNDYVGQIFIYNAKGFNIQQTFLVIAYMADGKQKLFGDAVYNAQTDRLEAKAQDPICLSSVASFVFKQTA